MAVDHSRLDIGKSSNDAMRFDSRRESEQIKNIGCSSL